MTLDDKLEELNVAAHCNENNSEVTSLTKNLPTMNTTFLPNSTHDETYAMSFQNGFAANCLDKIIQR